MAHYVYILQSEKDQSYYKGYTTDFVRRLDQHNNGESEYTSHKIPWKLVHAEELPTKRAALIREKNLKKATRERIEAIILSNKNLLNYPVD
ncbi:MAG TPA: GIY-YIG nuclease family protein [Hanamia sp.]